MARATRVYEPPALHRVRPIDALTELRGFGDLLLTLSIHRIKVRYKQSRLGILWAIIQPLSMMMAFTLMFTLLRAAPSGPVPFPLFLYAGLIPWTMFSSGLTSASTALTTHASLLTKVYFPREILPLTYVAVALVDFSLAALVLVGLMIWFGVPLSSTAIWALPAIATLTALLVGLGLLLSAVQVRYRDIGLALPVLMQLWLIASPVLYSLETVRAALPPQLYTLYTMNPMAGVVDTFRRAVVLHQTPDVQAFGTSVAIAVILVPAAYLYFKYVELTMADVI
jgi:lipopolysaccharide transport system permease protein